MALKMFAVFQNGGACQTWEENLFNLSSFFNKQQIVKQLKEQLQNLAFLSDLGFFELDLTDSPVFNQIPCPKDCHLFLSKHKQISIFFLIEGSINRLALRTLANNYDMLQITQSELTIANFDKLILSDKFVKLHNQLDETTEILCKTISSVLDRGERLDVLIKQSEQLKIDSYRFTKQAKKLNSCCG